MTDDIANAFPDRTPHILADVENPKEVADMIRSTLAERRQKGIDLLRQAGAVVHVIAGSGKIGAVFDSIEAGENADGSLKLIVDGHDISDNVKDMTIRLNRSPLEPTEIKVTLRPKLAFYRIMPKAKVTSEND